MKRADFQTKLDAVNVDISEKLEMSRKLEDNIETATGEARTALESEHSAIIEALRGLKAEKDGYEKKIKDADDLEAIRSAYDARKPDEKSGADISRGNPDGGGHGIEVKDKRIYEGKFALGKQLADIAASRGMGFGESARGMELAKKRLEKCENRRAYLAAEFQRAAGSPSYQISEYESGGIFLETETSMDIVTNVFDNSQLLSRCDRRTMTGAANEAKIVSRAETSRQDTEAAPGVPRHGGARWWWEHELDEVEFSQMKWDKITVQVRKIMSAYNASEEILQDVGMLTGEVNSVVNDEFEFKIQTEIFEGTAPGGFIGITKSPALYTVAKKPLQTADTIVWENARDMRAHQTNFERSIWLVNRFARPQLEGMFIPTGDDGSIVNQSIYKAAAGPGETDTLYGAPVHVIEQCEPLGDLNDFMNVDLSRYVIVDKGGMEMASSIHVFFLYDQRTFRFKARIGGMPKDKTTLQTYKGTDEISSIVTLAARA